MYLFKRVKTFRDTYPLVGPTIWFLSFQYFFAQFVVARAWKTPFSLLHNTISDLGNTACGTYVDRYVCSPRHAVMNFSFILLGVTMFVGSMLIYQEFKKTSASRLGFQMMAVSALGTLLVGIFPENSVTLLHILGAGAAFAVGNIGIIILSQALDLPKVLKIYSFLTGFISLVALVLFVTGTYLGLDSGGMERITAYPQTVWLIVFGIYISYNHMVKRPKVR